MSDDPRPGAEMTDQQPRDKEARLLARAIRQRWPIPENYRAAAVARMVKILADPESSHRDASIAAKTLLAMESQNQSDEHYTDTLHPSVRDTETPPRLGPLDLHADAADLSRMSDSELRDRIRRLSGAASAPVDGTGTPEAEAE